ncbi:MAG: hypothetical protein WC082_07340 [Victivallales bacterium]
MKKASIFKAPDYHRLEMEAQEPHPEIVPVPPDFSIPEPELPEGYSPPGEERLHFQLCNALLADRKAYAEACYHALQIIAKNASPSFLSAAERFAAAYAELQRLILARDAYAGFCRTMHQIHALERQISELSAFGRDNPLLRDHIQTLKNAVDDLRAQVRDKEELLEQLRSRLKDGHAEAKRFQRTNQEVSDIIYRATKGHDYCVPLRWSESTISRLNNSCRNGGPGRDGYPGNAAKLEVLIQWAVGVAIKKKKRQDHLDETEDEREQARFDRAIQYYPPDKLDHLRDRVQPGGDDAHSRDADE